MTGVSAAAIAFPSSGVALEIPQPSCTLCNVELKLKTDMIYSVKNTHMRQTLCLIVGAMMLCKEGRRNWKMTKDRNRYRSSQAK
jgi:hypothetical protein